MNLSERSYLGKISGVVRSGAFREFTDLHSRGNDHALLMPPHNSRLRRMVLFAFQEPVFRPEFPRLNRGQEINRVQNGKPGYLLLRPEVELLDTLDHL